MRAGDGAPQEITTGSEQPMTVAMETEMKAATTGDQKPEPASAALPLQVQHERLLELVADVLLENHKLGREVERLRADSEPGPHACALIGELVGTNQELRFKVARLNEKIAQLEKSPREEIPWAGMLI